jgi:hypothetical protein
MTTRIKSISQHVKALKDLFGAHPADVNISKVIAYLDAQKTQTITVEYPRQPRLDKKHTISDVDAYRTNLVKYEVQKKAYDDEYYKKAQESAHYNEILTAYMKDVSGLNEFVPAKNREKVYSLAYEKGHRNGLDEIYYFLVSFVNLFKD